MRNIRGKKYMFCKHFGPDCGTVVMHLDPGKILGLYPGVSVYTAGMCARASVGVSEVSVQLQCGDPVGGACPLSLMEEGSK